MRGYRMTMFVVLCLLFIPTALASSHREAPAIKEDPSVDLTDVYAFLDSAGTVTFIINVNPMEEPSGGPNFHTFSDAALYEIHIDNDGDAVAEITYRFDFETRVEEGNTFLVATGPVTSLDDENLNVRQFYSVRRISASGSTLLDSDLPVAPPNIGPKSTPDYATLAEAAVHELDGGKVFAGPRDDPFFVDLGAVFDLLTLRPLQNLHQVPPVSDAAPGRDNLAGYNVHTIALQVPIERLTSDGQTPSGPDASNAVIGVWSTTSRPRISVRSAGLRPVRNFSGFTQVSRLGMPLVNEVVIPLAFKDFFNSSQPSGDLPLFETNETFRNRVLDPEAAAAITALYGVDVPPAPRNDLVEVFLTGVAGLNQPPNVVPSEMLRLNLAIPPSASPAPMGVLAGDLAGFPNGRRLADDVVDIALRVVAGVLVEGFSGAPNNLLTDGVDANDRELLTVFPYVAMPHQGFEIEAHGE